MLAAAFNPLTVLAFDPGQGLDTVTTVLLLALVAVGIGIVREPVGLAPAGSDTVD